VSEAAVGDLDYDDIAHAVRAIACVPMNNASTGVGTAREGM
jgi:hypothetical protein